MRLSVLLIEGFLKLDDEWSSDESAPEDEVTASRRPFGTSGQQPFGAQASAAAQSSPSRSTSGKMTSEQVLHEFWKISVSIQSPTTSEDSSRHGLWMVHWWIWDVWVNLSIS
jgi:hypothetical protein